MSLMCRTRFDEPTRDKSRREKTTDGHTSSLLVYTKKKINAEMETQMRQRVFTGVVTQIQDHHGVVDQEVHFSMSVVVGRVPLVGEKVLVKAVQDPQKPVSWTAQRVQTLNGQPFKSPPPLLPSMSTNPKPGILGSKPQPLLKSPKIPPLIPSMQPNPGGMIQMSHHQQMSWNGPFDGWGGGRKRHGDVMGGRRAGRWEEGGGGGGMWGGDGMHKKRKIWRAISEEEVSKKTTSIPAQSSPLFSFFSRNTQACDSLEVQRRYPHLQVPSDLFHLQLSWTESFRLNQPLPLRGPCLFHVGSRQPEPEAPACEATDSSFSVRVLFLSLPCLEDFYSQCCSLSKDGQMQKEALHPTMLFKFLLLESGGDLQLPGGFWSPAVDGSNPGKDASTLVNTAVRCVKNQTALDLSACTQWHKMAELRYLSGEKMETVVFLMPDVWNQVQTEEEWAKKRQEQQDDDSPLPETPSLVFHPQTGLNLSVLSLSSLLEPQTAQTRDGFEVSLMAELFSEMLQRDFGFQLYQSLCSVPQGPSAPPACVKEDKSTAAEDEPKKSDKQQPKKKGATDSKRRKIKEKDEEGEVDEISLRDDSERPSEHQGESKTQSPGGDGQTSSTSDHQLPKDNDRPLGWTAELPRKVLLSCVFFDRQLAGSLREQDLLNMLLSLGLYLSPAQAQNLLRKVTVGGLCMYRNLCSRWTDTEQTHSSVSAEGNKALLPAQACKERTSSRRSTASSNPDMVNYRGNVVNMSNLLQALESSKTSQRDLEKCVANLQSRLEAAEGQKASNQQDQDQQEELKRKLEKAEKLNKTYEKSLRENANQMTSVIEKMQKMVEQTSVLTNTKEA